MYEAAASLGARNASTGRISNVAFGLTAKSSGKADVTRCRNASYPASSSAGSL